MRAPRNARVSPDGMKQMSWLSGLSATASPRSAASSRISASGCRRSGTCARESCSAVSTAEHVGLVLVRVDRAAQDSVLEPRVVAGGHRVEAERIGTVGQCGELDLLVAAQARVGRLARGVRLHEVVDHVFLEAVREIPDVEGDSEHVGGTAGVAGVLLRAASARSGAQCARRGGQCEVHADHVVAGVDGTRRGDRRVDSAAHGSQNSHRRSFLPRSLRRRPCRRHAHARSPAAAPSAAPIDVGSVDGVSQGESQRSTRSRPGSTPDARSARDSRGRRPPCTPNPWSIRCPRRRAASAANRPRSRGKVKCDVARKPAGTDGAVEDGVRIDVANSVDQAVPQGAQLRHGDAPSPDVVDVQRRRHPTTPAVSGGTGAHVAFVPTAVQQRHARHLTAQQQSADAVRDHRTCARRCSAPTDPLAAKSTGSCATRLHRVAVHRNTELARDRRRARRSGMTVPISLLAHITITSARLVGVHARVRPAERRDRTTPSCVDRQPRDVGALVGGQPFAPRRARRGARPRSRGLGRRRGSCVSTRPVDALDGEVVALGSTRGEDHLGRPGAEVRGDRFAGLLDASASVSTAIRAATTRYRRCGTQRSSPRSRRAASGWLQRDRGRPVAEMAVMTRPG